MLVLYNIRPELQVKEEMKAISKRHQETTVFEDEDTALCITVRRRHIWKDAKLVLSRGNNVYSRGIRAMFVSEAAVDDGGPTREFFRLALSGIAQNNSLFDGCGQRRVARHNLVELQGNSYLIVGRLIALSLTYGGPAPQFFATIVAEYLLSINPLTVAIEDVPDHGVQANLLRVCCILSALVVTLGVYRLDKCAMFCLGGLVI